MEREEIKEEEIKRIEEEMKKIGDDEFEDGWFWPALEAYGESNVSPEELLKKADEFRMLAVSAREEHAEKAKNMGYLGKIGS